MRRGSTVTFRSDTLLLRARRLPFPPLSAFFPRRGREPAIKFFWHTGGFPVSSLEVIFNDKAFLEVEPVGLLKNIALPLCAKDGRIRFTKCISGKVEDDALFEIQPHPPLSSLSRGGGGRGKVTRYIHIPIKSEEAPYPPSVPHTAPTENHHQCE